MKALSSVVHDARLWALPGVRGVPGGGKGEPDTPAASLLEAATRRLLAGSGVHSDDVILILGSVRGVKGWAAVVCGCCRFGGVVGSAIYSIIG